MPDPIPRNSRADENEEFRRQELERRGNRPLFGEGIGGAGAMRARDANPQQPARPNPFARPEQAIPRAQAPANANNRPQARPNPAARANLPPQNGRMGFPGIAARLPQAHPARPLLSPQLAQGLRKLWRVFRVAWIAVFALYVIAYSIANRTPESAANPAEENAAIPLELVAPVEEPGETCAVSVSDVEMLADHVGAEAQRVVRALFTVNATGCKETDIRAAVWVYKSASEPLLAPDADTLYRNARGQLTAQTRVRVDSDEAQERYTLDIPHSAFPTQVGATQWLDFAVQAWPVGQPAAAGSKVTEQVLFTRRQ